MDSWFGKIRQKLIVEQVNNQEDIIESDEERTRKEEQLKDTLRKYNTDQLLNEDEIARLTESARKPMKNSSMELDMPVEKTQPVTVAEPATSAGAGVLQNPEAESPQPSQPAEVEVESPKLVTIEDEMLESQFWD